MGHYDDCYEHDAEIARKHRETQNNKAKKLIQDAMRMALPDYDNSAIFRQKLEEAIFWMEK